MLMNTFEPMTVLTVGGEWDITDTDIIDWAAGGAIIKHNAPNHGVWLA